MGNHEPQPQKSTQTYFRKIVGIIGMGNPILVLSLIFLAISLSPWFDWIYNALSNLGVVEGIVGTLFNTSLIIGSILLTIFSLGILHLFINDQKSTTISKALGVVGTCFLLADAGSLCSIGLFPETIQLAHTIASTVFFVLVPIALILIGIGIILSKEQLPKYLGFLTIILGIIAAVIWMVPREGYAIPEIVSGFAFALWSFLLGFTLFSKKHNTKHEL